MPIIETFTSGKIVLFLFVGGVVSLDVVGLTLVISPRFGRRGRSLVLWSLLNGAWHAGLLFFYFVLFTILLEQLPNVFADWIEYLRQFEHLIAEYLIVILEELSIHAGIWFGLLTLYIVWRTYSVKIVQVPVLGEVSDLPPWSKIIANPLRIFIGRKRAFTYNVQAFLVAIDMLALAALMKSGNYVEEGNHEIYVLVAVIFVVVFCLAWLAGRAGMNLIGGYLHKAPSEKFEADGSPSAEHVGPIWVLLTIRLLEPFLIFYFVMELIGFLVTGINTTSPAYFLGSAFLVTALVIRHRMETIIKSVIEGLKRYQDRYAKDDSEDGIGGESHA